MWRSQGMSAVVALGLGSSVAVQVTPVEKVTELLTNLQSQVEEEGKREAASYDKFSTFCAKQADEKTYVIGRSDEKIEELSAFIEKVTADIQALDEEVVETKNKVETEEAEAKEKNEIRAEERKTYEAVHKDLAGAVATCKAAIAALKASKTKAYGNSGEAAAVLLSTRKALALLGFANKLAAPGEAAAYEYQSDDVISTIEKLRVTFRAELQEKDEEESTRAHDHNMVEGARANKISSMKAAIAQNEAISAHKSEDRSKKEKILESETKDRDADQSFLDDLTSKCEAKATAFDARSTARASEITAISEAIAALKSMGDAYSANKKLAGLVGVSKHNAPAKRSTSFLQVSASQSGPAKLAAKLQQHLDQAAKKLHSTALARMASSVTAKSGEDHFVKVRSIIKDLVSKLEADAEAEATAKSICDEQMGEAVATRDEKAHEMESISTDIDQTETDIKTLTAEIKALGIEIADLHKALKEITDLRNAEHEENTKTINDATAGGESVASAIASLRAFYGEALLQKKYVPPNSGRDGKTVNDMAPETFDTDEEYVGKVDASKGIFGLLEVIQSDFERTVQTVTTAEEEAEAAFQTTKEEMEGQIKEKEDLKAQKEGDVETKEADLTGFKDDLKDAKTLHEETLEELKKLKVSCIDSDETYEERVARRKKEIEALKEALNILENWKN